MGLFDLFDLEESINPGSDLWISWEIASIIGSIKQIVEYNDISDRELLSC